MKTVYEILYPFGAKKIENMPEDYQAQFPYTEIEPDSDRDLMLQFFSVQLNVWKPVEYMAGSDKLNLLENLYSAAKQDVAKLNEDNTQLQEKQASMVQLNAKLMLNDLSINKEIEAIKAQIGGAE